MLKRIATLIFSSVLMLSVFTLAPRVAYAGEPAPSGDAQTQVACEGGSGLGTALAWALCPIAHLITEATDFIQRNIIIPFLTVSPLNTNADNAVYILWQSVRNIANIMFIIAFFIVIFSQATSIGLSNYGIKRLLPKLAFVAIGSNLSYFIVGFFIDAFNVIGAGIGDLIVSAIPASPNSVDTDLDGAQALFYTAGGLALLFTPAAGPVLQWLLSLLAIAFLILLVGVIVLILRQMIILILIIISPLAFVAYLLPNTENYFDKWRKTLTQMLVMQPVIIMLFAVGKITTAIINSGNFVLASGDAAGQVADALKVAMGFFVGTLPIAALLPVFLASGSLVSKLTNAVNRGAERGKNAAGGKLGGFIKPRALGLQQRIASSQVGLNEDGSKKGRLRPSRYIGGAARYKAGYGTRRDFKATQRERELKRAQEEYLADTAAGSERFRRSAAGSVGGPEGAQRVLADAFATQEKQEKQELDNAMAVLRNEVSRRGTNHKEFAGSNLAEYLKTGRDSKNIGYAEIFSRNPSLFQAALNSAAEQGEVGTIEAARQATNLRNITSSIETNPTTGARRVVEHTQNIGDVDQTMVDRIIRLNDGKMKEKGGYHLATDFSLGSGRMFRTDREGKAVRNAQGNTIPVTDRVEMAHEMEKRRLLMMASTGAGSIAKMKAGVLGSTAELIASGEKQIKAIPANATAERAAEIQRENITAAEFNARRTAAINVINANPDMHKAIRSRMQEIASNPNTLKDSEAPGAIRKMYLKFAYDDPTTVTAEEEKVLQDAFSNLTPKEKTEVRQSTPNIPPSWT